MSAHHFAVGLEAAAGENDRISGDGFLTADTICHGIICYCDAGDTGL